MCAPVLAALNHHYGVLQAFALSEDDPEVDDRTLPKYKSIHDVSAPRRISVVSRAE